MSSPRSTYLGSIKSLLCLGLLSSRYCSSIVIYFSPKSIIFYRSLLQMAGDKKGKGKVVVEMKKKRYRDEREWARALAAADAADQPQRSVRVRGSEAEAERQGEPQDSPQLRRSARTRTTKSTQPSETRESHAADRAVDRG